MAPPVYDASNRKDIRAAEKAAAIAERNRINYLAAAMSTTQGRVWFYDLLEFCHVFADPFTGNALAEAYSKGERNVGLRIFADILTHCPDSYILMVKEANGRRTERSVSDSRRHGDPGSLGDSDSSALGERSFGSDPGGDVEGLVPDLFDDRAEAYG